MKIKFTDFCADDRIGLGKKDGRLEKTCEAAMEQIKEKGYLDGLKGRGFPEIYAYGIACYKKRCRVVCEAVNK